MPAEIFPCNNLAEKILADAGKKAKDFAKKQGRAPCLAVILAGNDPASEIYVRKKGETCKKYGVDYKDFRLKAADGFAKLEKLVNDLNKDKNIDGILVQSPLPKGWDERAIQAHILPTKDVDGFNPVNAGNLFIDAAEVLKSGLPSCTPAGVIEVLKANDIEIAGKHAVIIGRSTIVGKPMAVMLLAHDATVTICHSRTKNLEEECKRADILVSAVGRPHFLGKEHVKKGAAVIDVGISRLEMAGKQRIVGDVDAESIKNIASFITPVPNGIGPMTIAMLVRNTVRAAIANAEQ
jgi:methylenetetrahydrofolate dehydrogenase (NADP+)/methenyltetrahydrofolate cyclohydrolase